MEKAKEYKANITILYTERGDSKGQPSFMFSTKGIGKDKINKFELPDLFQWSEYEKQTFWDVLMVQGLSFEIIYKKTKPNYQLIKVDDINLTKPWRNNESLSNADADENTSLLINEVMKLDINPKSTPIPLNQNQSNYRNLTFLYRDQRIYIHAIPLNRIFFKVIVPEGTPFLDQDGYRWHLSTYLGETKMYQKHSKTGKEVIVANFRAPQYVDKKGYTFNVGQVWSDDNGTWYPEVL